VLKNWATFKYRWDLWPPRLYVRVNAGIQTIVSNF